MTNERPNSDDSGWTEAKSTKGVTFKIRGPGNETRPASAVTDDKDGRSPSDFKFEVDWRLGDGTYTKTTPEFREKTYIFQYAIHKNPESWLFPYILEFDLDAGAYSNYYFTDGEPDTYWKQGAGGGHYQLKYRSEDPNIKIVRGSPIPPPQPRPPH